MTTIRFDINFKQIQGICPFCALPYICYTPRIDYKQNNEELMDLQPPHTYAYTYMYIFGQCSTWSVLAKAPRKIRSIKSPVIILQYLSARIWNSTRTEENFSLIDQVRGYMHRCPTPVRGIEPWPCGNNHSKIFCIFLVPVRFETRTSTEFCVACDNSEWDTICFLPQLLSNLGFYWASHFLAYLSVHLPCGVPFRLPACLSTNLHAPGDGDPAECDYPRLNWVLCICMCVLVQTHAHGFSCIPTCAYLKRFRNPTVVRWVVMVILVCVTSPIFPGWHAEILFFNHLGRVSNQFTYRRDW